MARRGAARRGAARPGKAWLGEARQGKVGQSVAGQVALFMLRERHRNKAVEQEQNMKHNIDNSTREAVRLLAIAFEAYHDYRVKNDNARAAMWGRIALRYQSELDVELISESSVEFQQYLAEQKEQAA